MIAKCKQKKQLTLGKKILSISEETKEKVLKEYLNGEIKKFCKAYKSWNDFKHNKQKSTKLIKSRNSLDKAKNNRKKDLKKSMKKKKYQIKYKPNEKPIFKYFPCDEYLSLLIMGST